jgi:hypothetical protein
MRLWPFKKAIKEAVKEAVKGVRGKVFYVVIF